jgi:hypothetical protein
MCPRLWLQVVQVWGSFSSLRVYPILIVSPMSQTSSCPSWCTHWSCHFIVTLLFWSQGPHCHNQRGWMCGEQTSITFISTQVLWKPSRQSFPVQASLFPAWPVTAGRPGLSNRLQSKWEIQPVVAGAVPAAPAAGANRPAGAATGLAGMRSSKPASRRCNRPGWHEMIFEKKWEKSPLFAVPPATV